MKTSSDWIGGVNSEKERGFVLLHELHEHNRMAGGMLYGQAHAECSRHFRKSLSDGLLSHGYCRRGLWMITALSFLFLF
jgi:hypothetical protein